jgi:hypothetical protein
MVSWPKKRLGDALKSEGTRVSPSPHGRGRSCSFDRGVGGDSSDSAGLRWRCLRCQVQLAREALSSAVLVPAPSSMPVFDVEKRVEANKRRGKPRRRIRRRSWARTRAEWNSQKGAAARHCINRPHFDVTGRFWFLRDGPNSLLRTIILHFLLRRRSTRRSADEGRLCLDKLPTSRTNPPWSDANNAGTSVLLSSCNPAVSRQSCTRFKSVQTAVAAEMQSEGRRRKLWLRRCRRPVQQEKTLGKPGLAQERGLLAVR